MAASSQLAAVLKARAATATRRPSGDPRPGGAWTRRRPLVCDDAPGVGALNVNRRRRSRSASAGAEQATVRAPAASDPGRDSTRETRVRGRRTGRRRLPGQPDGRRVARPARGPGPGPATISDRRAWRRGASARGAGCARIRDTARRGCTCLLRYRAARHAGARSRLRGCGAARRRAARPRRRSARAPRSRPRPCARCAVARVVEQLADCLGETVRPRARRPAPSAATRAAFSAGRRTAGRGRAAGRPPSPSASSPSRRGRPSRRHAA